MATKLTIEQLGKALVSSLTFMPIPNDTRVKDAVGRVSAFVPAAVEAITALQAQVAALEKEVQTLRQAHKPAPGRIAAR